MDVTTWWMTLEVRCPDVMRTMSPSTTELLGSRAMYVLGAGKCCFIVSTGMVLCAIFEPTHFSELLIPFLFCDAHPYRFGHLARRDYDANFVTREALWNDWFAGYRFGRYRRHGGWVDVQLGEGGVVIAEVLRRFPSAGCARKSLFQGPYSKTATQYVLVSCLIAGRRRERWCSLN